MYEWDYLCIFEITNMLAFRHQLQMCLLSERFSRVLYVGFVYLFSVYMCVT